jgi:hypothetical protein
MAINFPSSPTDGQKFTLGTMVYTYSTSAGAWHATPLGTALPFNYFVNPSFQHSQENGVANNAVNDWHSADQWTLRVNPATSIQTDHQDWRSWPNGSRWRYRTNVFAAKASFAADEYAASAYQVIEGARIAAFQWGSAQAKPIVIRFWLYGQQGQYSISVRNGAQNRSYVAPFLIPPFWHNTLQEWVFSIPGDTIGTWAKDNTAGMVFCITWGAGSTYRTAQANQWAAGNFFATTSDDNWCATAGNTSELMDCGLYLDPNNTGKAPPWELRNDHDALMESQRYWYRAYWGLGVANTATALTRPAAQHPVPMRAVPTITLSGAVYVYDGAVNATPAIGTNLSNTAMWEFNGTCSAVTNQRPLAFNNNATGGTAGILVNARM